MLGPVGVIAITAVRGATAGFGIGHGPGLRANGPEHRVGAHGAGTLLGVVGLQQQTPLVRPEPVERADDVLEVQNAVLALSLGVRGVGHQLDRKHKGVALSRSPTSLSRRVGQELDNSPKCSACATAESVVSAEQRTRQTDADAMNQKVRDDTKRAPLNSQEAHIVTEVHARDLLSLSLQLLQPKRETEERTTKNSKKLQKAGA